MTDNIYAIWSKLRAEGWDVEPVLVAAVCIALRDQEKSHADLAQRLRPLATVSACINGTPMVPLHLETVREIVSALGIPP